MGYEFPVVALIIDVVTLVKHIQTLVHFHSGHHSLCLDIEATTETFDVAQEANNILCAANGDEFCGTFQLGLEGRGALVKHDGVRRLHPFLIFILSVLSLGMFPFQKVEINI